MIESIVFVVCEVPKVDLAYVRPMALAKVPRLISGRITSYLLCRNTSFTIPHRGFAKVP